MNDVDFISHSGLRILERNVLQVVPVKEVNSLQVSLAGVKLHGRNKNRTILK